ncbi:hypothetical protein GCM10010174_80480 [Kutzneria viridogrisea]
MGAGLVDKVGVAPDCSPDEVQAARPSASVAAARPAIDALTGNPTLIPHAVHRLAA